MCVLTSYVIHYIFDTRLFTHSLTQRYTYTVTVSMQLQLWHSPRIDCTCSVCRLVMS